MKCHNCRVKVSRSELRKHVCDKLVFSEVIFKKGREYLKKFGSRPSKS
jgi:hypothetical protein